MPCHCTAICKNLVAGYKASGPYAEECFGIEDEDLHMSQIKVLVLGYIYLCKMIGKHHALC